MKLSASKVLGDRIMGTNSFSKMERAHHQSQEGLVYLPGESERIGRRSRKNMTLLVGGVLITVCGLAALLTLICAFSTSPTESITLGKSGIEGTDTVVETKVTGEQSGTKTERMGSELVITTITVTEITTTTTTRVPLSPGPIPYTTTSAPETTTVPSTTTWRPAANPCRELPEDPYSISAASLLLISCKDLLQMEYNTVECKKPSDQHDHVFRNVLTLTEYNSARRMTHTFTADGNSHRDAKNAVARKAAEQIFGLNYTASGMQPIPSPHYPCVPVTLESQEDEMSWPEFFENEESFVKGVGDDEPTTTTPFRPSTPRPLPDDPTKLSAITLLDYTKDYLHQNYTLIQCRTSIPPVFRVQLTINEVHSFFGDSNTKRHAKERAARAAVVEMFQLDYSHATVIPEPPKPCIPVGEGVSLPYTDSDEYDQ